MEPNPNQIVKRVWDAINIFIHLLLLSIFSYCFGYPMVRDYIHSSTVFTEKTIKYNDLPGITFVNLIAGSSAWNHGWKLENLDAEKPILEEVCTKYPNFTSTYREYVKCIDASRAGYFGGGVKVRGGKKRRSGVERSEDLFSARL